MDRFARLRSLSPSQWGAILLASVITPAVRLSLRHRGLVRTAASLASWSDRPARPANADVTRSLADAVGLVGARPVIGAPCLGRSLVLWYMLRCAHIDAEVVIGAAPPVIDGMLPAHAWVEVDGLPVNDVPNVREQFGTFDLSLPRLRPDVDLQDSGSL